MKKEIEKIADKLVYAYKKNKLINPIPIKFTKNIENATKLRNCLLYTSDAADDQ